MKCDKLMQDALNLHIDPEARAAINAMRKPAVSGYTPKEGVGIDINSKLVTALNKIMKHENSSMFGSPYMKKESLYKRLTNEGVSKKEIDLYIGDLLNREVLTHREKQLIKMLTPQERAKLGLGIERTTLGRDKVYVSEALKKAEAKKLQVKTISDNKFNSITYDGQGMHNSTYEVRGLVMPGSKVGGSPGHFPSENGLIGWSRSYVGTQPGIDGKVLRLDEFQSDWAQNPDLLNDLGDLPIDHNDFKKLMIVDGIDRAMLNGLDTIVIPITRTSNNLVGTEKVSQNYLDLQKGILPKIRQQLDKKGLKLEFKKITQDVIDNDIILERFHKALYSSDIDQFKAGHFMNIVEDTMDDKPIENMKDFLYKTLDRMGEAFTPEEEELVFQLIKDIPEKFTGNEAWVLKIADKTGRAVSNAPTGYSSIGLATGNKYEEMLKDLKKLSRPLAEMPNDTKVMIWLDDIPEEILSSVLNNRANYDRTGEATVGELKRLLAFKEKIPANIYNRLEASVIEDSGYIKTKSGDAIGYDIALDNIDNSMTIDEVEDAYLYFKDVIPGFPEFFRKPSNQKAQKIRWDALSIATALGLGEAYSKLQKEES